MTAHIVLGVGYIVAAMTCLVAWRLARRQTPAPGQERQLPLWLVVGLLLGTMGIVRATHLANSAEDASRRFAAAQGWYQERRQAQIVVIVALLALWARVALSALGHRRREGRSHDPVITVIVLTSLLVLGAVRAVSFHYSDSILSSAVLGTSAGNLLEVAGIGLIIVLASRADREIRRSLHLE